MATSQRPQDEQRRPLQYERVVGWCGFTDEDGNVAIVSGDRALDLARRYEPFPIFRLVVG